MQDIICGFSKNELQTLIAEVIRNELKKLNLEPIKETIQNEKKELITQKELSKRLNKSIACIIDWKKRGLIPYLKISNKVYFDWNEVIKAMKKFEGLK